MKMINQKWRPAGQPPRESNDVLVRLPDGKHKLAHWNGSEWWCNGSKVSPRAWCSAAPEACLAVAER